MVTKKNGSAGKSAANKPAKGKRAESASPRRSPSSTASAAASAAAMPGAAKPTGMPGAANPMAMPSALNPLGMPDAANPIAMLMSSFASGAPQFNALQADYMQRVQTLMQSASEGSLPSLSDKRFADASWQNNGLFTWNAALYLLNAEFMGRMAENLSTDARARDKVKFAIQQWVDAMSPANYLISNPEAQKLMLETQGRSLMTGAENLLGDMQLGRISQNDDSAFEVGRNVATSQGSVIFQNELVQLIQYTPTTAKVRSRPLLLVPPCINKFYILDLQPENSFVAHAVSEGHQVFLVSWRNVGTEQEQRTWNDYLQMGVVETIKVVQQVSGQDQINALGFCVGGTILSTALAALAARDEHPVASLTLMTTLLDFSEPGVLGVFIDEQQVAQREQSIGKGGLLKGQELATTFSFLRPNDLVWNYVVNNYLKGKHPPAFDLLYWNGDGTNLPGPMFVWYLRHLYLQNELRIPSRLTSLGQPIDLGKLRMPVYVFGAKEDHIVPWDAAYLNTQLVGGPVRYVLGASGHIAGAINPASKNKRSYWTGEKILPDAQSWFKAAEEHPGSWWIDWRNWLSPFAKQQQAAPATLGNRKYLPLEAAPGSYVKQRAE